MTLLDEAQLARLRAGYDEEDMLVGADLSLKFPYPVAGPWTDPPGAMFYRRRALMPHRERERCLLAVLTGQRAYAELGVHIYWGLMEGLDIEEIANVLLLASTYTGIPTWRNALRVLRLTLQALAAIAEAAVTDPEKAATRAVVPALGAALGG